jgi:hypothetical protein
MYQLLRLYSISMNASNVLGAVRECGLFMFWAHSTLRSSDVRDTDEVPLDIILSAPYL